MASSKECYFSNRSCLDLVKVQRVSMCGGPTFDAWIISIRILLVTVMDFGEIAVDSIIHQRRKINAAPKDIAKFMTQNRS